MALGHEAAGEVVEIGRGVDDLLPGDHVVVIFVPSCGHCLPCTEGRPALCEPGARSNGAGTLLSGERRLRLEGRAVHHHMGVSARSEEHTSELQSLMRISYAVFCLKKKHENQPKKRTRAT